MSRTPGTTTIRCTGLVTSLLLNSIRRPQAATTFVMIALPPHVQPDTPIRTEESPFLSNHPPLASNLPSHVDIGDVAFAGGDYGAYAGAITARARHMWRQGTQLLAGEASRGDARRLGGKGGGERRREEQNRERNVGHGEAVSEACARTAVEPAAPAAASSPKTPRPRTPCSRSATC